jgi:hypothetical protein
MERIVAWVLHDPEIWDAFEVQMGATYLVVITKIRDNPYLWFWATKSLVSDFPRALTKFKKSVMHKNIIISQAPAESRSAKYKQEHRNLWALKSLNSYRPR